MSAVLEANWGCLDIFEAEVQDHRKTKDDAQPDVMYGLLGSKCTSLGGQGS